MSDSSALDALREQAAEHGLDLAVQAAEDAEGILSRLLGPLATEVGERLALPFRERRIVRTAVMLRNVEARLDTLESAGADRVAVPERGAIPLLEAASLETDADLTTRYESLLTNAAVGTGTDDIGSLAEILRQLSPRDAQLLQYVFAQHVEGVRAHVESVGLGARYWPRPVNLRKMARAPHVIAAVHTGIHTVRGSWSPKEMRVSTDNLFRLGLLRDVSTSPLDLTARTGSKFPARIQRTGVSLKYGRPGSAEIPVASRQSVILSDLGLAFSIAVNPPDLILPDVALADR